MRIEGTGRLVDTRDGRASRSLSTVGPSANSWARTVLTATSPHPAVTPCPSSAATPPITTRRSASQLVRSTMRGSAAVMCLNFVRVRGLRVARRTGRSAADRRRVPARRSRCRLRFRSSGCSRSCRCLARLAAMCFPLVVVTQCSTTQHDFEHLFLSDCLCARQFSGFRGCAVHRPLPRKGTWRGGGWPKRRGSGAVAIGCQPGLVAGAPWCAAPGAASSRRGRSVADEGGLVTSAQQHYDGGVVAVALLVRGGGCDQRVRQGLRVVGVRRARCSSPRELLRRRADEEGSAVIEDAAAGAFGGMPLPGVRRRSRASS